jgi:hypothetical protein
MRCLPKYPQKLDEDKRQHDNQVDAEGVQSDFDGACGLDTWHDVDSFSVFQFFSFSVFQSLNPITDH